ncbi:hypothetical protein [Shinella sp.]|uniref:hypothetical protein n=1 Tax=Shinella sp. TaxID=1870904 RepID=UPI00301DAD98
MIDTDNFCHIEQAGDGVKVLFWVEHDGDEAILHQVANLDIGIFDLKLKMPAERLEAMWPDDVQFAEAAAHVLKTAADMGLSVASTVGIPG